MPSLSQTFAIGYLQVPNATDAYSRSDESAISEAVSIMTCVDGHDAVIIFVQIQLTVRQLLWPEASRNRRLKYHSSRRWFRGGRCRKRTEITKVLIK